MVNCCAVVGCKSTSTKATGVRFFRFPKVKKNVICAEKQKLSASRRKAWFHSLCRKDIKIHNLDTRKICGLHFISGKPAEITDINNPDWIPSVNMGKIEAKKGNKDNSRAERYERRTAASNSFDTTPITVSSVSFIDISNILIDPSDISLSNSLVEENSNDNDLTNIDTNSNNAADEPLLSNPQNEDKFDLMSELQRRTEEVFDLRRQVLSLQLTEASLEQDEEKLKFYTGLPNLVVFRFILNTINDSLQSLKIQKLSNFQMLLMTLMKLRLNTSFKDLGYRFDIRSNSASLIFTKVIIKLSYALRAFIFWPSHEAAKVLMPACFQKSFGDSVVAVIIDCFEIAIEKPSTLALRATQPSFSQYKERNTVKYVIGFTPHGTISFISKGYEGRVSDKTVTEDCGILDNLLPGDVVMAGRGFTISELPAERGDEGKLPDFIREQIQLHPKAVENRKDIANIRIRVEHIIDEFKNHYGIMNGPIEIGLFQSIYDGTSLVDFIVKACCILTNFGDAIIAVDE